MGRTRANGETRSECSEAQSDRKRLNRKKIAVQPSQEPVLTEANCDPKHAFRLRFDANNRALYIDGRSGCSVAAKMNPQKCLNPWFQTLSYPEVSTVGAEIVQNSIDFECLTARTNSTDPGWKRPADTGLRASLKPFLNDLRTSQHGSTRSYSHVVSCRDYLRAR